MTVSAPFPDDVAADSYWFSVFDSALIVSELGISVSYYEDSEYFCSITGYWYAVYYSGAVSCPLGVLSTDPQKIYTSMDKLLLRATWNSSLQLQDPCRKNSDDVGSVLGRHRGAIHNS